MAIKINCEWCNKEMASVGARDVVDWLQRNGEVCKECSEKIKSLDTFFSERKAAYVKKMEGVINEAKEDLKAEIKRLAAKKEKKDKAD